ncbi:MAG: ATP-binding cassette domain-containing protein [Planctomycetota bacterium]|nr:ATP-binding cassette domain-containing protein [Planctomycetota bacterium]
MSSNGQHPAVRFRDVVKHFGDFTAVKGISFEVPAGSIFGILGSNGAGKTTSIRMLMNIFKPDGGTVEVLGSHVSERMKPRLGYLPEERGLYKKMRIEEMLRFFGHIKGRDDAFLQPRIDRWLDSVGLAGWRKRRVEELSKGMSQKLQFVTTVIHEPELLVLDEPFAGLDPVNRDVLRDAVLAMNEQGTTIVFSTHVMEQAEQLCQELIMIHHGEVQLSGSVDDVRRAEGRDAAHIRYRLHAGKDLQGLPGVIAVTDHGNEAELTLEPGTDANALLAALLERAEVRRFELRAPSLHEIFKRVAGAEAS